MKATQETVPARAGPGVRGGPAFLHDAAQCPAFEAPPQSLQLALARVADLEQALASSQQDAIVARRKVEMLRKANAHLRKLGGQRGIDDSPGTGTCRFGIVLDDAALDSAPGATWKMSDFCLSAGLGPEAKSHIERLLTRRNRYRRGDVLYRVGDGFNALYAVRSGSCKTVLLAKDGRDQVAGYHMAGEVIGIDGVGSDLHECQATALEDTEVCPLPFDRLAHLGKVSEQFRRNLQGLLSQEIARSRALMVVLGTMRAEQRVAAFLLDLSQRYQARGYSSSEFVLRMTREEIGSYLGLKLETVSRLFSRFQREGLIRVEGRGVKLLDRAAVNQLISCRAQ